MYFVLEVRLFLLLLVRILIMNILFSLQSVSEFTTVHLIKKKFHGGHPDPTSRRGLPPPAPSPASTLGRRPSLLSGPHHLIKLFQGFPLVPVIFLLSPLLSGCQVAQLRQGHTSRIFNTSKSAEHSSFN